MVATPLHHHTLTAAIADTAAGWRSRHIFLRNIGKFFAIPKIKKLPPEAAESARSALELAPQSPACGAEHRYVLETKDVTEEPFKRLDSVTTFSAKVTILP